MINITELLQNLDVGLGIAEQETGGLGAYFVETNQWRRIFRGDVDIIYGQKGSGKSALYSLLLSTRPQSDNTIIIPADNPRGTPAFKKVETNPPTTEMEFIGLWKLYITALVGNRLNGITGERSANTNELIEFLSSEQLIDENRDTLLMRILAWLSRHRPSVQGGLSVDPGTGAVKIDGKISLEDLPVSNSVAGASVSVNKLLEKANIAMKEIGKTAWIAIDRLDVAFIDNTDLEENALSALFHTYLDLLQYENIKLKIFLRTDIWRRITNRRGFPEASHIVRQVTIEWTEEQLLNLIMRRLLNNPAIVERYDLDRSKVLADVNEQRKTFSRIFPAQVVPGERRPNAFTWMLTRTADGTRQTAPRELIQLLNQSREVQLRNIEIGASDIIDEAIFGGTAIKAALDAVSRQRIEQTIYPEYPSLKPSIEKMEGQKAEQNLDSLSTLWGTVKEETAVTAARLVEIGIFEKRGIGEGATYWIPFLYRPVLKIVQGSAEAEI